MTRRITAEFVNADHVAPSPGKGGHFEVTVEHQGLTINARWVGRGERWLDAETYEELNYHLSRRITNAIPTCVWAEKGMGGTWVAERGPMRGTVTFYYQGGQQEKSSIQSSSP